MKQLFVCNQCSHDPTVYCKDWDGTGKVPMPKQPEDCKTPTSASSKSHPNHRRDLDERNSPEGSR